MSIYPFPLLRLRFGIPMHLHLHLTPQLRHRRARLVDGRKHRDADLLVPSGVGGPERDGDHPARRVHLRADLFAPVERCKEGAEVYCGKRDREGERGVSNM